MTLSHEDLGQIKQILSRDPSVVELSIFDTMWSEHCSYKSSKPVLKQLPTKASSVALGIGEDAGIIRFHEQNGISYCIAVSHESHNHPSQILPIEGAATGVGGCVRDVYCMGADVIGVLNSLHFGIKKENGNPLVEEVEEKVVLGVADYGNPLGVPVLGGETLYHDSYNDNCLVNVAALGLVQEHKIIHSYAPKEAAEEPYDVILFGKPTDATGYGGASFSSETLDDDNEAVNVGAVQVHDPFLKRVLAEAIQACLDYVEAENIPIGFKDLGAGGISCATSEIAVGGGFGIDINLNKVNVAFDDLNPEVIACSETQERFCMTVPKTHSKAICDIFNDRYQMPVLYPKSGAVVIGEITTEKTFIIRYNDSIICDLDVTCITTEVSAHRVPEPRPINTTEIMQPVLNGEQTLQHVCETFFDKKMAASKRYVYRFFDNAVRGNTVVYPGEADSVVIKPLQESNAGLAVTMDSNLYGDQSPYSSGASAVAESVRNLISVGATPLALTDCLNYGNPEKPPVFFDFEQGVKGISDAAQQLSGQDEPIPIISGNVSFYNESAQGNAVIPSPVICALGKVADINQVKTAQFFEANCTIFLIGKRRKEFASTQIRPYLNDDDHAAPAPRFDEERNQNNSILALYKAGMIDSCHDISSGGLWTALVEMVLGERGKAFVGAAIDISSCEQDSITTLFSENGGYVIASKNVQRVQEICEGNNVIAVNIGTTTTEKKLQVQTTDTSFQLSIDELSQRWNQFNP